MQAKYHGKLYDIKGFARSTVLPEEFVLLEGNGEFLVAPTHDLSGLIFPQSPFQEARANETAQTSN
jgi:hypothetical protein